MSDPGRYLAGVGIAMATTFMSALGMTLQKKTHQRLEGRREAARRKHRTDAALASYRQPLWMVGLVLMAASALLSLAVFALVGQSVASAFASITIVWSFLLAVAVLRERVTPLDVLVAALMIVGTVLAVYFGSRGANGGSFLSLDDILRLQRRPAAYAGWAVFGSLILLLGGYSVWQDRRLLLGHVSRRDRQFRATIATRTATAGLFSGVVGFLSKAVVSIFAKSASGAVGRNLGRWEVWVFLLLLPTALVFQVAFLNTALRHFPAAEAVPLYQSQVVIWGVVFGWTLYAEGAGKSGGQVVGFIAGIVVIVAGIFILLAKRRPVPPTLTVLEAVKALAVGELLVQVTALRRARTAPGSLAHVVEAAARCRRAQGGAAPAAGCDTSALASLEQLVPVQTSRGTAVRALLLIHPQETTAEPVSPRELLAAPTYDRPPAGAGGGGTPGDANAAAAAAAAAEETQSAAPRRRVPPSLRVNVLLPAGYALQSEPARDRRYRATASVATVSELLYETEVPGVPELTRAAAAASAATAAEGRGRQPQRQQPARARGPAAEQLSLFLPPGLDYVAAPLTFIPPPVAAAGVGSDAAASARTIGGSVQRRVYYPSLRRIGLTAGGPPIPVAAAGTAEAGELLLRLPLPPPPPRPARERVLSAPAEQLQLPPRADAGRQQRAALAAAGASAARLSPVAEEEREEAAAATEPEVVAAQQRRQPTTIASPPPDFVRRARSLSAAAAGQLTGSSGGGGFAAIPALPAMLAAEAAPAASGADGGEGPTLPVAVVNAGAAATTEDVQPPVVEEEGEPSAGGGPGLLVAQPAVAPAAALPPSPQPPPFPSLISVPLAVIQTLPGIDGFLLTSFLRAEASAEFEAALAAAAEEKRRVAAAAAAKRQAAGRRRWGRRRLPPSPPPPPPPPPVPPEQVEVVTAAPAAPSLAAAIPASAGVGGGGLTVAVTPKTALTDATAAGGAAAVTTVVTATTTTTVVSGQRRRRSLSDVQSALLPVLALPAAPAATGVAIPPPSSPLARGHVPALSSEPVLALAQLHALGSPGVTTTGRAGAVGAKAAATSTVDIYAGVVPAAARTPTGTGTSAARQRGPGAAAVGEERDVTSGEL